MVHATCGHSTVLIRSQLFAAGPPVVRQATFEDLSKEALGGWEIHAQNGTVDNVATSELDAFRQIRAFLSYLPSSIFDLPPVVASTDGPDRREGELISIIPRRRARPYDIRRVIHLILDIHQGFIEEPPSSTFFEIGATWGRCIVTGLGRLSGRTIGVLSSDCMFNGGAHTYQDGMKRPLMSSLRVGAIDALGSQKTARFVNLCDHFGSVVDDSPTLQRPFICDAL